MRPKGVVDGQQVNIPAPRAKVEVRRDAFWKVSGVLDIPVPQGRGHIRFRSHWKESQEKPMLYNVPRPY